MEGKLKKFFSEAELTENYGITLKGCKAFFKRWEKSYENGILDLSGLTLGNELKFLHEYVDLGYVRELNLTLSNLKRKMFSIASFNNLEWLCLAGTRFFDFIDNKKIYHENLGCLCFLEEMTSLKHLDLGWTDMDVCGLEFIQNLPDFKLFRINGSNIKKESLPKFFRYGDNTDLDINEPDYYDDNISLEKIVKNVK